MKISHFLFILAVILLGSTTVYAIAEPPPAGMTTVPLATITNDRNAGVSTIYAMLNDQAVFRGIYVTTTSATNKSDSRQGEVYWLSAIENDKNGKGVVLGQGQGVEAIYLRGHINSQKGRGTLVIEYLANGLFWSYDQCRIGLKRVAPYNWQLVNDDNDQPITKIKVQTWALGISTLTNVCPSG